MPRDAPPAILHVLERGCGRQIERKFTPYAPSGSCGMLQDYIPKQMEHAESPLPKQAEAKLIPRLHD
jgi:hypothetical protein